MSWLTVGAEYLRSVCGVGGSAWSGSAVLDLGTGVASVRATDSTTSSKRVEKADDMVGQA